MYKPKVCAARFIECVPDYRYEAAFRLSKRHLEALVEPALTEAVHGWRRGHSVQTAISRITAMNGALYGLDIVNFFQSINQHRLGDIVRTRLADGRRAWEWIQRHLPETGLPEGAPWSPLLANLYLCPVDERFPTLTRYGDNLAIVDHPTRIVATIGRLRSMLNTFDLATHDRQRGEVIFCRQLLAQQPDGTIQHRGRGR